MAIYNFVIYPKPASQTLIYGILKAGYELSEKCKLIQIPLLGYDDVDEKSVKSNQASGVYTFSFEVLRQA